ncbi:hypothetical protein BZA05DRAFT_475286 [Tricharina praecox]|uniref:uncharacterized protein n=1 Tax=Tricharina praecox TaxID=43433 RepID=UPI00221F63CB|nr:uncharacterized protein BZA05DRAFT_475286 [Tricharina praecox]KAI5848973.1 hypothetical protein BZA05DRAFT_475286 [Tricharina praecox]
MSSPKLRTDSSPNAAPPARRSAFQVVIERSPTLASTPSYARPTAASLSRTQEISNARRSSEPESVQALPAATEKKQKKGKITKPVETTKDSERRPTSQRVQELKEAWKLMIAAKNRERKEKKKMEIKEKKENTVSSRVMVKGIKTAAERKPSNKKIVMPSGVMIRTTKSMMMAKTKKKEGKLELEEKHKKEIQPVPFVVAMPAAKRQGPEQEPKIVEPASKKAEKKAEKNAKKNAEKRANKTAILPPKARASGPSPNSSVGRKTAVERKMSVPKEKTTPPPKPFAAAARTSEPSKATKTNVLANLTVPKNKPTTKVANKRRVTDSSLERPQPPSKKPKPNEESSTLHSTRPPGISKIPQPVADIIKRAHALQPRLSRFHLSKLEPARPTYYGGRTPALVARTMEWLENVEIPFGASTPVPSVKQEEES